MKALQDYDLHHGGAGSGDTVQICRVVEGVVGWTTSAAVP